MPSPISPPAPSGSTPDSLGTVQTMVSQGTGAPRVVRAGVASLDDASALLHDYFDSVGVLLRDDAAAIRAFLDDPTSGLWIAYVDGAAAGCVALRPLPALGQAAECKRLYVDPAFRRRGLAELLVAAMETYARAAGYASVYLDSKDDLRAAIALYGRLGYVACPRYNDNPQATVFMRKSLQAAG